MTVLEDRTERSEEIAGGAGVADPGPAAAPATPRGPRLGTFVGAMIAAVGASIGARPLVDSSFLTHLATGRYLLVHGIPRSDPYTFTARGSAWTVQSWFASLVYAGAERAMGMRGIQIFTALVTGALCLALWSLSRPARSLLGRLLIVVPAIGVGAGYWAERPFLIGLLCLAAVLAVCDDRLDRRWLVPVMWLWVNSHGSFPFAVIACGTLWLGKSLDDRRQALANGAPTSRWGWLRRDGGESAALRWVVIGSLAAALNPLTWRLLWFPVVLLQHSATLHGILEWQAASYDETWQKLFLVEVIVVVVGLARRPSWRAAVPAAVFLPLGLYSQRNMTIATIVLIVAIAPCFERLGTIDSEQRRESLRVGYAGAALAMLLVAVSMFSLEPSSAKPYPAAALGWWEAHHGFGPDTRLITPDVVGNYLEAAYGGSVPTFLDDRAELFDTEFMTRAVTLYHASSDALDQLDRFRSDYGVQGVLWMRDKPVGMALVNAPGWRVVYSDKRWLIVEPR